MSPRLSLHICMPRLHHTTYALQTHILTYIAHTSLLTFNKPPAASYPASPPHHHTKYYTRHNPATHLCPPSVCTSYAPAVIRHHSVSVHGSHFFIHATHQARHTVPASSAFLSVICHTAACDTNNACVASRDSWISSLKHGQSHTSPLKFPPQMDRRYSCHSVCLSLRSALLLHQRRSLPCATPTRALPPRICASLILH